MLNQTNARQVVAKVAEPVARGLNKMGISPDAVTIVGTVATSASALWFFPRGQFVPGVLVILLFVFSDLLDGTMARLSGRQGDWGAFLDSTLDRIADGAIFAALLVWAVATQSVWTQAAALICLVGGQVISYSKARAQSLGYTCDVGIAERTERLLVAMVAAFVYGLGVPYVLPAALWILAVLSVVTVGQRMAEVARQAKPHPGAAPAAGQEAG